MTDPTITTTEALQLVVLLLNQLERMTAIARTLQAECDGYHEDLRTTGEALNAALDELRACKEARG